MFNSLTEEATHRSATRGTRPLLAYGSAALLVGLGLFAVYVLRDYYGTPTDARTAGDVWLVRVAIFALVGGTTLAIALLGHRMSKLILAMRARRVGSRFHIRLARRFALIGILPACFIAILALLTVVYGLDRWFSSRVGNVVENSVELAGTFDEFLAGEHLETQHAILGEQLRGALGQAVVGGTLTLEGRLVRLGRTLLGGEQDDREWNAIASILFKPPIAANRVALFSGTRLLEVGKIDESEPDPGLDAQVVRRSHASGSGVPIPAQVQPVPDLAQAQWPLELVVALPATESLILYVDSRREAPIVEAVRSIFESSAEYEQAAGAGLGVAWGFALIYGVGAVVVTVAAIMVGFLFADQMVGPIGRLAGAAARIEAGDLSARVEAGSSRSDEVGNLIGTFNQMAESLQSQQDELIRSHEREQEGRLFAEGVLRGTTVGIIGLDRDGRIRAANRAASDTLGSKRNLSRGASIHTAFPEIGPLLAKARLAPDRVAEAEVSAESEQLTRQLRVRAAPELEDGSLHGFVVTFEDITGRAVAERMEAWKHLAEIMAHEIKNPLNPIKMKAQALQDMVPVAAEDQQQRLLAANTELVVRKVEEIRRLVDDFRSFASMPEPQLEWVRLSELVESAVDFVSSEDVGVEFRLQSPQNLRACCDPAQLSRALANVLVNAILATAERAEGEVESDREASRRNVDVRVAELGDLVEISIRDNGPGFPPGAREMLLEPYVTHRPDASGTGLGLAVVRWILESHGGEVLLRDPPDGSPGAVVRLRFPAGGPMNVLDFSDRPVIGAQTHVA